MNSKISIEKNQKNIKETIHKIVPICLDHCVVSRKDLNKYKLNHEVEEYPNFNTLETDICINKCLLKGKYVYNSIINIKNILI